MQEAPSAVQWWPSPWGGADELDQMMLCDAQTSGGLLVAIPRENADRFEVAVKSAARIGKGGCKQASSPKRIISGRREVET